MVSLLRALCGMTWCCVPDQVSLTDMPDFSFDLQVLGGDVTLLPGLEAWLNSYVRHSLLRCAPFCACVHDPQLGNGALFAD
jgi:hypothetical protein